MPTLSLDNAERYIFSCKFDERLLAKDAGFKWDHELKKWYTWCPVTAAKLRKYMSESENAVLTNTINALPENSPLPIGLLPHQIETVKFALKRTRNIFGYDPVYLGLDPGLGKTACAAAIAVAVKQPVVYIAPPFLLRNVEEEFKRWAPSLKSYIYTSKTIVPTGTNILIVPDSLLIKPELFKKISELTKACRRKATLIVDEAHRFKNDTAKRTTALLGAKKKHGLVDFFERQIFMSGTPMPNRPIELFPILSKCSSDAIRNMNRFEYGIRYCAGYRNEFGWDFSGASNLDELRARVVHPTGNFMIRLKKELLKLPPKTEEVFVVSDNMSPRLAQMDHSLGEPYATVEDLMKHRLALKAEKDDLHLMTYRRLLGVEKVKPTAEYIKSLMEETDESILIFAYHKEVVAGLVKELNEYNPLVITGDTLVNHRHELVKTFQSEKSRRLLIGNYVAMGVGFNLTKANRVVFAEFDWVPGVNEQAADRAHRIGQTGTVLVQYIAYKDSIDKLVIESLIRKRKSTKQM